MKEKLTERRILQFEVLEERLVLTTSTAVFEGISYEEWRTTTYSLSAIELAEYGSFHLDDQLPVNQPSANLTQADDLIGLDRVRTTYPYTGAGYTVAIIDTGIDYNHSALGGGWGNRVIAGWDFVGNDSNPMDENGHGTHVAGIIGSSNATYRGIAPDVNFVALRVLDANGNGTFGAVEDALRWVINHQQQYNIVAVNMSLGAGSYSYNPYSFLEDEFQALVNKGVFIAASSGNSFYTYNSMQGIGYPSISPNVVSVGAVWDANVGSVTWSSGAKDFTTAPDRITSFTQRGPMLDLLAPGAYITAPYRGGGYATMAGTSMAAPAVAGAAVLLHQALDATGQHSLANQNYIRSLMRNTGVNVVDGDDENDNVQNTGLTFKRLDLYAALVAAVGSRNAPPSINPIPDYSVPRGQDIVVPIVASDPNGDALTLSARFLNSSPQATLQLIGNNLHINIADNYIGSFVVQVSANDGKDSFSRSFRVTVYNRAPVIEEIASQNLSSMNDKIQLTVKASDADGDTVTLRAEVSSQLWALQQHYGFHNQGTMPSLASNLNEKWIRASSGTYYYILPNGNLYKYLGGPIGNSALLTTVDPEAYKDLSLLLNAGNPADLVNISLVGSVLTITPKKPFPDTLVVTVFASDGAATTTEKFNVRMRNEAPVLGSLPNLSVGRAKPFTVNLGGHDPEGDKITYTVKISNLYAELKERFGLYSLPSLGYNANSLEEKWIGGADGRYFVRPNGLLYKYLGSGRVADNSVVVASVGLEVYNNPSILTDFPVKLSQLASVQIVGSNLIIDPHDSFVGTFTVEVTASDWLNSTKKSFSVTVSNRTPQVTMPESVSVSHSKSQVRIPLTITDADGDAVQKSVTIQSSWQAVVDNLGIRGPVAAYNIYGLEEKWIQGTNGMFFILPTGRLYRHLGGSIANNRLVTDVGLAAYMQPELMAGAKGANSISATIQGNELVVNLGHDAIGPYLITVHANDGNSTGSATVRLSITNNAPQINVPSSFSGLSSQPQLTIPVAITDPDGDPLDISVSARSQLLTIKQQLNLQSGLIGVNLYGMGEKWLVGANGNRYFLMPNGALKLHLGGGIGNNRLVTTLGPEVYQNPSLLYNASEALNITGSVQGNQLVLRPSSGAAGNYTILVTASDGIFSTQATFTFSVSSNQSHTSGLLASALMDRGAATPVTDTTMLANVTPIPQPSPTWNEVPQDSPMATTLTVTNATSSPVTSDSSTVQGVEQQQSIIISNSYTSIPLAESEGDAVCVDEVYEVSRHRISPRQVALTPDLAELLELSSGAEDLFDRYFDI